MREVFRGWKRKCAVVALLISSALTLMWMRSEMVRDELTFCPSYFWPGREWSVDLVSLNGSIDWHAYYLEPGLGGIGTDSPIYFQSQNVKDYFTSTPKIEDTVVWQWRWGGLRYGAGPTHLKRLSVEAWSVPYWSFVLPLSLFSGWFLLSRSIVGETKVAQRSEP